MEFAGSAGRRVGRAAQDHPSSSRKAREAHGCELKTEEYLSARATVIKNAGAEATALTWLYKVLGADGISTTEDRYLKKLEKRWFA